MRTKLFITFVALIAFLLLPGSLQAANSNEQLLVLTQTDGNVSKFALADEPVITYSGNDIVVTCGDAVLQTSMANVESVTFEKGEPTSISEMRTKDVTPSFSFNTASFEGLQAGAAINVFSIEGKMVSSSKADAEGKASIDMGNLPTGVYILRTPNKSFKIKK